MCTVTGADNWYDILTLDSTSMKNINDAKHKIQKKGKPVTHDRIISELTFGFWTSFLTPRYSQASFQSKIIKTCFRGVPAAQKNIKYLQTRFDRIRVLMLMYGKEASNRKQEIDRQHYTIPNQRPKDKHCGKI